MASKTRQREWSKARRDLMKRFGGRLPTVEELNRDLAAIVERNAEANRKKQAEGEGK